MKETTDNLQLLISQEAILEKIASFASEIDKLFEGQEIVVLMILKGSICLVADLIRQITIPFTLETIRCQSYGLKGMSRGDLTIEGLDRISLSGKNVLLVDDIYDTGHTLYHVKEALLKKNPKKLLSAVLLNKNVQKHQLSSVDYSLFNIEDEFVIGYGLDYNEHYRGLRGIYKFIKNPEEKS